MPKGRFFTKFLGVPSIKGVPDKYGYNEEKSLDKELSKINMFLIDKKRDYGGSSDKLLYTEIKWLSTFFDEYCERYNISFPSSNEFLNGVKKKVDDYKVLKAVIPIKRQYMDLYNSIVSDYAEIGFRDYILSLGSNKVLDFGKSFSAQEGVVINFENDWFNKHLLRKLSEQQLDKIKETRDNLLDDKKSKIKDLLELKLKLHSFYGTDDSDDRMLLNQINACLTNRSALTLFMNYVRSQYESGYKMDFVNFGDITGDICRETRLYIGNIYYYINKYKLNSDVVLEYSALVDRLADISQKFDSHQIDKDKALFQFNELNRKLFNNFDKVVSDISVNKPNHFAGVLKTMKDTHLSVPASNDANLLYEYRSLTGYLKGLNKDDKNALFNSGILAILVEFINKRMQIYENSDTLKKVFDDDDSYKYLEDKLANMKKKTMVSSDVSASLDEYEAVDKKLKEVDSKYEVTSSIYDIDSTDEEYEAQRARMRK